MLDKTIYKIEQDAFCPDGPYVRVTKKDSSGKRFYVYVLADHRGTPFYVGKGVYERVFCHENEAQGRCTCDKCQKIRSVWQLGEQVCRIFVLITADEQEAYDYERQIIAEIGLSNLCNKSAGGHGSRALPDEVNEARRANREIWEAEREWERHVRYQMQQAIQETQQRRKEQERLKKQREKQGTPTKYASSQGVRRRVKRLVDI